MTLPISHGYPDWGRFQARADVVLHNEANTVLNANATRGRFFVGGVEHIAFIFDGGANPSAINVNWWSAPTGGIFLGQQLIDTGVNGGFDWSLPVVGPWLEIVIAPVAFPTTISLTVWTVAGPVASVRGEMAPEILFAVTSVVGAGGTSTLSIERASPGLTQIHIFSTLAAFVVAVDAVTVFGITRRLYAVVNPAAAINERFFLPASHFRVIRTNNTGADGAINVTLVRSGLGMVGQG